MIKTFCDKCHNQIEGAVHPIKFTNPYYASVGESQRDLCSTCVDKLMDFLNVRKGNHDFIAMGKASFDDVSKA